MDAINFGQGDMIRLGGSGVTSGSAFTVDCWFRARTQHDGVLMSTLVQSIDGDQAVVIQNSASTQAAVLGMYTRNQGGGATWKVWNLGKQAGTGVDGLTQSATYPAEPTYTATLSEYFEANTVMADQVFSPDLHTGQQIRGWFWPPSSGAYVFTIASDSAAELRIGSGQGDARAIAFVPTLTASREWDKYLVQTSEPCELIAGRSYLLESLAKSDPSSAAAHFMAVGVTLPDGTRLRPIPTLGYVTAYADASHVALPGFHEAGVVSEGAGQAVWQRLTLSVSDDDHTYYLDGERVGRWACEVESWCSKNEIAQFQALYEEHLSRPMSWCNNKFAGCSWATHLMGYWNFEDGPGSTTVTDVTGNGQVGRVVGGSQGTTKWPPSELAGGRFAKSFDDDPNDVIVIEAPRFLPKGRNARTMMFWTKGCGQGDGYILSHGCARSSSNPLMNTRDSTFFEMNMHAQCGHVNLEYFGESGFANGRFTNVNNGFFNEDTWHHLAVTWDENVNTGYMDGDVTARHSASGKFNTAIDENCIERFTIGDHTFIASETRPRYDPYRGTVDEVAVFDIALSADDISVIYNGGHGLDMSPFFVDVEAAVNSMTQDASRYAEGIKKRECEALCEGSDDCKRYAFHQDSCDGDEITGRCYLNREPTGVCRTCAELEWPTVRGNPAVCGESDNGFDCAEEVSFTIGSATCTSIGARLCTADELRHGEAANTGCFYDASGSMVWSSSSADGEVACPPGERLRVKASRRVSSVAELECALESSSAALRCCADDECPDAAAPTCGPPHPAFTAVDLTTDWVGARAYCREHYHDLASIHSTTQHEQALAECRRPRDRPTDQVWAMSDPSCTVGLMEKDDITQWSDGSPNNFASTQNLLDVEQRWFYIGCFADLAAGHPDLRDVDTEAQDTSDSNTRVVTDADAVAMDNPSVLECATVCTNARFMALRGTTQCLCGNHYEGRHVATVC
jgi:hypothetical protein